MEINGLNNINAMLDVQAKMNESAANIANVANTVGDPALQEVSQELIDSITNQIPLTIAYEANANAVTTKNAVSDVLLNLKA